MLRIQSLQGILVGSVLVLAPLASGCSANIGSNSDDITDVKHTDVERQSIGNCWLYAEASWAESMNLSATGSAFDVSQSYWTYWHWFSQILDGVDQIETGGSFSTARTIILERGLMPEASFIQEDTTSEMSTRQSAALATIQKELKDGRLKTYDSRANGALVRQVMDESWQLTSEVRSTLTTAFGEDGSLTLKSGGTTDGTNIVASADFPVRYTERKTNAKVPTVKDTTLNIALNEWTTVSYPSYGGETARRSFQIRVQKALHDAQPVVITWSVDFNAMESYDPVLKGSFNLTTLKNAGKPGRQGGHMTVLEDYEAVTEQFGLLPAGTTLDPSVPNDREKLDAALLPSTEIKFFRIKNSWGALRDDRSSAPGFPGYHDLYMDYLNGPITWCPDVEGAKTAENCKGTSTPFSHVVVPPGY